MGDLSEHFSRSEFADHRTGEMRVNPLLVQKLERLRAIVGRPCVIVSGYRSPATNKSVGGAPHSQHLTGAAADLKLGYATIAQARVAGFTGIGHCQGYAVHVDVRPGLRVEFPDC